jgi:Zn-dependent peptidase ImmA (M78 family)
MVNFRTSRRLDTKMYQALAKVAPFQTKTPVDVKGIAEQLGVNVWELTGLPDTISGKLFIDHDNGGMSGFSIGVNSREGYKRKRFTIAHELAHYLLHRHLITNGVLVDDALYRSDLSSREEVEANKLAADILMPRNLINELTSRGITDVESLAEMFKVSIPAMKIRLNIPII